MENKYMKEIRTKVIILLIIFFSVFITAFFMSPKIFKALVNVFKLEDVIVSSSPFQMFSISMTIAFFISSIAIFPILLFMGYKFISDGLYRNEKSFAKKYIGMSLILFIAGFIFGSMVMVYSMSFLINFSSYFGVKNLWNIELTVNSILVTSFCLGLFFEMPLLLTALIKMNMIKLESLKKNRFIWWFVIYIILMLLPPTDLLSDALMYLPIIFLYEFTLLINRRGEKI